MINKIKAIREKIKKEHIIAFVILTIIFVLILASKTTNNFEKKKIRAAAVAGSWYPGDKETLEIAVQKYLDNVAKANLNGTIKAIIVPHAGYQFSGQIAAAAFKQLDDIYNTVILLGPSHYYPLMGISIPDFTHYETPLGEVKLSLKTKQLSKEDITNTIPEAHSKEHSIEIELPFLQKILTNFELIPILVGSIDLEVFQQTLQKYIDDKTLIVVSVDLSHYHSYDEAKQLDYYSIDRILSLDEKGILNAEIDAPWAVATLLKIAEEKHWKPYLLYYANSGDVTGDKSRVVGYAVMAFIEKSEGQLTSRKSKISENLEIPQEFLSEEEQKFLLKLARQTAEEYLKTGKKTKVDESKLTPALNKVQGCFTTFNKNHNLRGCIGHILPQEELYKCVMDNAISAAVNDKRFQPVVYDEMKEINIEISVLTVPQKLEFLSGEDLLNKLRPMVDGVVLKQGMRQSTYLPQVWANFKSKEEFLPSLCIKGEMPEDCWKNTSTEVYTYQAFVFEEE